MNDAEMTAKIEYVEQNPILTEHVKHVLHEAQASLAIIYCIGSRIESYCAP